jgi:hypothetical protein
MLINRPYRAVIIRNNRVVGIFECRDLLILSQMVRANRETGDCIAWGRA